jgi:hypothetical protein
LTIASVIGSIGLVDKCFHDYETRCFYEFVPMRQKRLTIHPQERYLFDAVCNIIDKRKALNRQAISRYIFEEPVLKKRQIRGNLKQMFDSIA